MPIRNYEVSKIYDYLRVCPEIGRQYGIKDKTAILKCDTIMVHRGHSTQFQDSFGPNPIFLPYSVTKLWIFVLSIFLCISLFLYPIFACIAISHLPT